jgi:hypothetical protein
MKTLLTLLFLFMAFDSSAQGQSASDTSGAANVRHKRIGMQFIDEDGDGIDDRRVGPAKPLRRGKDKFVDADGDGICDDRASGLGFRRGARINAGGATGGKGKNQGGKP